MLKKCRLCGENKYDTVLDMGMNPLVNSLVNKEDLDKTEPVFPLEIVRCKKCSLVQHKKPIDSNKIYKEVDYLYFSSDMPGLSDYFEEYATEVYTNFLQPDDFVVEIGSNDGVMLRHFADFGHPVLGIDPATNVAIRALSYGIPTVPLFFTERLARLIEKEMGRAKVIYGNNCIAHIDDLDDVMKGVTALIADKGVFIVECNYWGGMVKNKNYALVYHDHFSYFSLKNWIDYADKHGMQVFDATVTPAQGGSLRVFMSKYKQPAMKRCLELVEEEAKTELNTKKIAQKYGKDCIEEAHRLFKTVEEIKAQGKTIAGYGAAAKGFSVLMLAGIDQRHIDYFVDDSPAKQGKYTPVSHIPVISRQEAKTPDYFFITAPNYAEVIIAKEQEFLKNGGKFILCDSTIVG